MADILILISQEIDIDEYGNEEATETETAVFCEVGSITQSEFFASADTELQPEFRFSIFFGDYNGQDIVEYQGKRYSVYRTYRSGDYMELYVERKIGNE